MASEDLNLLAKVHNEIRAYCDEEKQDSLTFDPGTDERIEGNESPSCSKRTD